MAEAESSKIVSHAEWLEARKDLLVKEKEFTRQRDALSAARRKMPWVKLDKDYVFDTPGGKKTLAALCSRRLWAARSAQRPDAVIAG